MMTADRESRRTGDVYLNIRYANPSPLASHGPVVLASPSMPYHAFQVTSVRHEHHEKVLPSEDDTRTREAYNETVISFKIPNEDLRPFGHVLYGLLGIFYVPLFIDGIWDYAVESYLLEGEEQIPLQQRFVDTVKSRLRSPLECLHFLLDPILLALGAVNTVARVLFHLIVNLVTLPLLRLCCGGEYYVFVDPPLDELPVWRRIARADVGHQSHVDGEVEYELEFRLRHRLKAGYGQTIAVGFGPFAHWCLFRANRSFPDVEK